MDIRVALVIAIFELRTSSTYNTDTSSFRILKAPRDNSFFGYSMVAAQINGSLTVWSGSPKYTPDNGTKSEAKGGSIYSCEILESTGPAVEQKCKKLRLTNAENRNDTSTEEGGNSDDSESSTPEFALPKCLFEKTTCSFVIDKPKLWLTSHAYLKQNVVKQKHNNREQFQKCYGDIKPRTRLTGPPTYTVHEGLIALNSDKALKYIDQDKVFTTTLTTKVLKSRSPTTQCLRFCYNAYSLLDNLGQDDILAKADGRMGSQRTTRKSIRALRVYLQYENSTKREKVFQYQGPKDIASKYWNFTEINLYHEIDGLYKLYFEASVKDNRNNSRCAIAADIVLTDITVSNAACQVEGQDIDVIDSEQSIGMSLEVKVEKDETSTLTTCGPFWQQNCGFNKESTGVCYEISSNSSKPRVIKNPGLKGCIRGKIDIVLLVDQSGSVNQCNFQKVKSWLRNIVRGFTIGPNEQDIGIVVYSDKNKTKNIFELGFENYGNSGDEKKRRMLDNLRKLPYEAGKTFTGVAFEHANQLLWGPQARKDARKMVILLTDGATTPRDKINLDKQVNISRANNATILAVGVADINEEELISISGGKSNFFRVAKFSELGQVRDTLRQTVSYTHLEGSKGRSTKSMQNCHMGFSLHQGKDALLMGSPGCFNWAGDVMRYGYAKASEFEGSSDYATVSYNRSFINQTSPETTTEPGYSVSSEKIFEIPTLGDLEEAFGSRLSEAYLGYAVTSGSFFGESQGFYIAASAPRLKATGGVLIYKSNQDSFVSKSHAIHGEQLGEYFGASLCAVDVNNDGFTDLLIGAPLHIGVNADEGRVYVFMGGVELSKKSDLILEGSGITFSRFGTTITAAGDINMDRYKDVIVSAPTEENGKGAIYIFRGGRDGLYKKYAQRVAASSFNRESPFRLFGQSVYGGVDVDNNGYPDILVGSPGSDEIVILKSRPVVHIVPKFFTTTPIIDRLDPNCWAKNLSWTEHYDEACISFTVCFSYYGVSVPPGIGIQYKISSDIKKIVSRIGFHENNDDGTAMVNRITLWNPNSSVCVNHSLYLKNNIQDMMTKLRMKLTYEMEEYKTDDLAEGSSTSDVLAPVLEIIAVKNLFTDAMFKTYCEDTSSCIADISVNDSGPVSERGEPVEKYELSAKKLIRFKLHLSNAGPEEAHAVMIAFYYPVNLVYSSLTETNCFKQLNQGEEQDPVSGFYVVYITLLEKVLKHESNCTGILNFLATPQVTLESSVRFFVNASTISEDKRPNDNGKEIVVGLQYKSFFTLNGLSHPDSIYGISKNSTNLTDPIFSSLEHIYTIRNIGPFTLCNLSLSIQWPVCAIQDEALYHVAYVATSCSLEQNHEYCKSTVVDKSLLEKNSSACGNQQPSDSKNCKVDFCPSIHLLIESLPPYEHISIIIKGEVDLLQFSTLKRLVPIASIFAIRPLKKELFSFSHNQIFRQSVVTTIYPPHVQEDVTEVKTFGDLPIWVYILSIGVGILLLIILVILLWRLGFFESKYAKKKKDAQEDQAYNVECVPMNPSA